MSASRTSPIFSTAKEIALAFAGSGVASASGWHDFRCPAHDDKTASCGVKDDRGGKIAVKCHAGCERDAILDAIEAKGLVVRQRSNRRAEKKPPEELFGDARIVEPSLLYFPARGLDSAAFPVLSRAVRFAPRFWHAASKAETPALIVALTDEAGQVRAIQRLYLTADCRAKACRPMSLGKISGLAIKLGPPTDTLYVAEGLEDAMTAQQASEGESSAWAAAGSSNMPNLVVPDAVKTVLGQNDKDDPRQRDKTFEQNLAKAAPKLTREGKAVRVAWPPAGVKDINDLVKGRIGAALSEGYADVKRMIDSAEEVLPADDDDAAAQRMQGSQTNVLIELALMTANCSTIRRASVTRASAYLMTAALTERRTSSSRVVSGSGSCTCTIATRLALPTQTQCRPR
jgi:putative DNA primase/helicase